MAVRKQKPAWCDHCSRWFKSGAGLALHLRWVGGMTHPMKGKKLEGEGLDRQRKHAKNAQAQSPSGKKKGVLEGFTCQVCGKIKQVKPSVAGKRKYCSMECLRRSQVGRKLSNEHRKQISEAQKQRFKNNPRSNPFFGRTPSNMKGWGHGQYVEELGYWVRSTWERDYLLGLVSADISFTYEPSRFDLGDCTYLPDVQIDDTNIFVEITGWDKPGKVEKRAKFKELIGATLIVVSEKPTEESIARLVEHLKEVMP